MTAWSMGSVSGEYLACGYHGLEFDVKGQCVKVPGQTDVPSGARVRSYPAHERNNIVWIWMGDAAKADVSKIPDMPWLSDPKWAVTPGRLYVKSNYQFILDNLLAGRFLREAPYALSLLLALAMAASAALLLIFSHGLLSKLAGLLVPLAAPFLAGGFALGELHTHTLVAMPFFLGAPAADASPGRPAATTA